MKETTLHPLEAILRLCARAAPAPWFPKVFAEAAGVPTQEILSDLEHLWLEGLIHKVGGTPQTGPAFALTEEGRRVVEDADLLRQLCTGSLRPAGDRGAIVREALLHPPRSVVSRGLLAANLLVFAYGLYLAWPGPILVQAFLSGPLMPQALPAMFRVQQILHASGALQGEDVVCGEWWRLFSAGFVHIGLLHLGMNMYGLYVMGWRVEAMWGRWRFLVIYFVALLGGSCAQVAIRPAALGAGASGALCGLVAAAAVWVFLNRRFIPWELMMRWRSGLIATLVLMVGISLVPGVGAAAHLGGALGGGVAAWLLHFQRFGRPPWSGLALAGIIPLCGAGIYGIDWARASQKDWHEVERRDFEERLFEPAKRIANHGGALYNDDVLSLLRRHAGRRNAESVARVQKLVEEQVHDLDAVHDLVARTGRFYEPGVELQRQELLAALDAELAMFTKAADCLAKGEACSRQDEDRLQQAVEEAEARWQKLRE